MSSLQILSAGDQKPWLDILSRCAGHDFFHLPQFHALAEANGEGKAHLFVYQGGAYQLAVPLLLRPLVDVPGLGATETLSQDATSVYGYAGPLCSHAAVPAEVIRRFQSELAAALRERQVVCVFSRLHPLMEQTSFLAGLGECVPGQQTVSIDLTLSEGDQRAQYRRNHTDGIRRLRKLGMICDRDESGAFLADFMDIYHGTMQRRRALASYFFSDDYYRGLLSARRGGAHLFVGRLQGQTLCAALILECNGIVQYYLGGSRHDASKLAPMKLLIETVRAWAQHRGNKVFHLGGGTTTQPDDSLLHFKKGFSDRYHSFFTWRWVLEPHVYERLCAARRTWDSRHGQAPALLDYFPLYRAPTQATRSPMQPVSGELRA